MRHTTHTTQVFTLFGGGYVPEDHGRAFTLGEPVKRSGKMTLILVAALFSATTAAAAVTVSSRVTAPAPKIWYQNPPTLLMKLPEPFGVAEMLF
jgi:hypothetical protein